MEAIFYHSTACVESLATHTVTLTKDHDTWRQHGKESKSNMKHFPHKFY